MVAMTSAQQKSLLDHALNISAYTPPTTLYLGLHTGNPTKSGSYANEVSTSGTNYGRQLISGLFSATSLSTGKATLSTTIFIPPTSSSAAAIDWGTISYVSVDNHETDTGADTMRFFGAPTTAQTVSTGERFQAVAGQFAIRFQ